MQQDFQFGLKNAKIIHAEAVPLRHKKENSR